MSEQALSSHAGLQTLDYAVIVLYMLTTFGIALWFGSKQKDTDDFFVGGRRMPWFAVGLSILATLFSTLSYLGGPGEMIKNGISLFVGNLAIPFSMLVVFYFWIPFFMRLKVTSAYEYLEHRFSYSVRLTGSVLFILLRLGWMSMVVYAASMALRSVQGIESELLPGPDIYWWIMGVGVFASVYTAVGGIQAMIWTDVLQCFLLLTGVLMAIFYVIIVDGTGPWDWWRSATSLNLNHTSLPLYSFDVTVRNTVVFAVIGNFFWTIATHGSDQVVLQRYFSTGSAKEARRSYLINVCVDLTMNVLLSMAGLALLAFYLKHGSLLPPGQTSPVQAADKLFPHFLGHQLPMGCAGLIIAAFICDAMQTLESGVNSITAVVNSDIVPRLRGAGKKILSELTFVRMMTVIITGLVTANACFVAKTSEVQKAEAQVVAAGQATAAAAGQTVTTPAKKVLTLIDMMPKFFNMFVGPLAAMFVVGMFIPRATTRSVLPAALIGLTVAVCWSWNHEIFGVPTVPATASQVATAPTDPAGKPDAAKVSAVDGKPAASPIAKSGDAKVPATANPPTPYLAICVPWLTTVLIAFLLSWIVETGKVHPGQNYTWYAIVKQQKSLPQAEGSKT